MNKFAKFPASPAKYKIEKVSYAYQYQDSDGRLIFRYDNAVHRPALRFKEHKHIKAEVIIEAFLPDISDIIDEVVGYLCTFCTTTQGCF